MAKKHWKENVRKKIEKETGLEEHLTLMYEFFIEAASLSNGIVMFGEVKHNLKEFIQYAGENPVKYGIDKFYGNLLNLFKEKKLITDYVSGNGTTYPKIIGYNFYDDEEFFFAFRKKGEKTWTERISKKTATPQYILRNIAYGYEFKNKELEQMVLN